MKAIARQRHVSRIYPILIKAVLLCRRLWILVILEVLMSMAVSPSLPRPPLYRAGKDNHGQAACAACHGAAHAIWPNRDPNDNVTALQLQGHSGPIAECSVCHTADAFAKFDDIDEGLKVSNPIANLGVCAAPLHKDQAGS
ncbi:MAG: hypothetical protein ABL919_12445 [Methylococcales bacterium]|nr:hypothetical protein [Methylococcaceae bacterium]